ncbi:MAG: TlpA disulfide reductase family protein [Colwellia sp.]
MQRALITFFLTISLLLSCGFANANEPINEFEQAMVQHKGKVVYVDFWASWCVPCRKSFPWMNAMQAKYKEQGFVVLSINLDAEETLSRKFLQQTPANFAIIYDAQGKLARKFKLTGMPSSYLFDRQSKLISAHSGFNDKKQQQYEREISQALAQEVN